ncbi:MAG: oligopeptidase A, partial [Acidiferrobacterales bacterium]
MQGADDQANPLLDLSGLPRFSAIRAEHVLPALGCVLSENRAAREQLLKISSPTWDNFVQPLEDMDERLSRMWSPASHLNAVRNTPALRQVFNDGQTWISEYRTELAQDERLYRCLKKIAEAAQSNGFEPPQRKILDNALRDFRLNGAQLDGARKQRFKEIQKQLASLSNRFQDNVLDATQAWELVLTDEADLAGLPQTAQLMARQTAQHEGKA